MNLADEDGFFRVLCFDFDGKDKHGVDPDLMEQAQDQCDSLSRVLDDLEIAHVVCESSGTGGRHIWFSLQNGVPAEHIAVLARAARANYATLDYGMLCNPGTGSARPPLSPHRDGSRSRILRGELDTLTTSRTTAQDLEALAGVLQESTPALRAAESSPSGPVDAQHRSHRPLSSYGTAHMATIDGGDNPSWTGFMCLLAAANAGWSLQDVEHAVKVAPGMEHFRTKNTGRGTRRPRVAGEARDRLARQWAKAQQYAAVQRPLPAAKEPRDLTELAGIVGAVEGLLNQFRVSPGRWGRTEKSHSHRTVLTALAYLTLQTGKRTVAASIRDIALMAGIGRTTVADALIALSSAGYVQRITATDGGNAAEWRLLNDFSPAYGNVRSQPLNNPRPPTELFTTRALLIRQLEEQLLDQRHDLFTRAGLGHAAGKVYALLRTTPIATVEVLAQQLGLGMRYTATILSRLRTHKLLAKHVHGWTRSKRDLRDHVARILGVAGVLAARIETYRVEREIWAWWQAETSTMAAPPRRRPRRPHVSSRTLSFEPAPTGERSWPRYPRSGDGRGDHREARFWAVNGMLAPDSLWWSSAA
jgi:DNA-binding IscR family transcriptional regulator